MIRLCKGASKSHMEFKLEKGQFNRKWIELWGCILDGSGRRLDQNFATIRTIAGRCWCGSTMVKAVFFCNGLGDEKVHAQQFHHAVMAMVGSIC